MTAGFTASVVIGKDWHSRTSHRRKLSSPEFLEISLQMEQFVFSTIPPSPARRLAGIFLQLEMLAALTPHRHPKGEPWVSNGLGLCKLQCMKKSACLPTNFQFANGFGRS